MRTQRLSRRLPAVRLGYVTECIDRECLKRRRTGTRQVRDYLLIMHRPGGLRNFYSPTRAVCVAKLLRLFFDWERREIKHTRQILC